MKIALIHYHQQAKDPVLSLKTPSFPNPGCLKATDAVPEQPG